MLVTIEIQVESSNTLGSHITTPKSGAGSSKLRLT